MHTAGIATGSLEAARVKGQNPDIGCNLQQRVHCRPKRPVFGSLPLNVDAHLPTPPAACALA